MTTAPALDFAKSRYDAYMEECATTKAAVETAWLAHYEAAMRFKESEMWKAHAPNWETFCDNHKQEFFAASTYRAKGMDAAIAAMMMQTVTEVTPTETESRKVRESLNKLTKDKVLKAETYARAHEATGKVAPSFGELKIAYEEIQRVRQDKVWTIEGEDLDPDSLVIDANIQQGIYELYKRKTAHIQDSMGIETRRAETQELGLILPMLDSLGKQPANNPRDFKLFISWHEDKQDG